jgi:hypothetical protein
MYLSIVQFTTYQYQTEESSTSEPGNKENGMNDELDDCWKASISNQVASNITKLDLTLNWFNNQALNKFLLITIPQSADR